MSTLIFSFCRKHLNKTEAKFITIVAHSLYTVYFNQLKGNKFRYFFSYYTQFCILKG